MAGTRYDTVTVLWSLELLYSCTRAGVVFFKVILHNMLSLKYKYMYSQLEFIISMHALYVH